MIDVQQQRPDASKKIKRADAGQLEQYEDLFLSRPGVLAQAVDEAAVQFQEESRARMRKRFAKPLHEEAI